MRDPAKGTTLLELLLALALTGVVMVVISMAIDLHLRTLDAGRQEIEQTQVARAVLQYIASDIRSAVWYEPIDVSGAQQTVDGTDPADLMGAGGDALGDAVGDALGDAGGDMGLGDDLGADLGMDLGLDDGITLNTLDIAGTVTPTTVPGLYGNQSELQVDVSRLPRVDQYERALTSTDPATAQDIPSDVKTIAYYLNIEDTAMPGAEDAITGGRGLIRRQIDRAVASWGSESGELDPSAFPGQALASEVNYLEFRYFDGIDWVTEWDSAEIGSLPLAIEITVGIDPLGGRDPAMLDVDEAARMANMMTTENLFRLVVRLPMGKAIPLEMESMDMMGMEL